MVMQIAVIAAIMLVTSATHIVGLWALEPLARRFRSMTPTVRHALLLLAVAMGLLALHSIEILEYAVLYRMLGALDLETAVFFSASAYSTIGTGAVHLPDQWRLVGAFEGINGFVLIGWSTAALFAAWRDARSPVED